MIDREPLILASASPRRSELLGGAGVRFSVLAPPEEAEPPAEPGEPPVSFVRRAARAKAIAVWESLGTEERVNHWILAADTVVALRKEILGKPRDHDHALAMLNSLAGNTHRVLTAFTLLRPSGQIAREHCESTEVRFASPPARLIEAYIATGEPADKAGAYAIQGRGAFLVRAIRGSYTNVVGLPLAEVLAALDAEGVPEIFPRSRP